MKNCKSIKNQFPAYIDDELASDERLKIKEHLKTCPDCAYELNELKKSIECLRNLDEVKPPPWLTKKVMTSIKAEWANIETPPRKSLFEKIFYPFYIKVPAGALAAIFIAVITVYIFKVIEPAMEYKAPQESPKESSAETEPLLPSEQKAKEYILGSRLEKDSKKPDTGERPEKEPPVSPNFKMPDSALSGVVASKSVDIPAVARENIETKKIKSPEQELKAEKLDIGKQQYSETSDKKTVLQGIAAQEHYFYVTTDDLNAENKIVEAIKQAGGTVIRQESRESKIFVSAEMPALKIKELADNFRLIGTIREKPVSSGYAKDRIGIKIEILKTSN